MTVDGILGDGRAHAKHLKPTRAISLLEEHIISQIQAQGYAVAPGAMGENLTIRGLDLLALAPGTRLRFSGGVEIELVEPRTPCFVLDAIHPDLKAVVRGRFGSMARVVTEGVLRVGESFSVFPPLTGAILAGGQSRRMGQPKEGVVLWDGRPMIEHVIDALQAVCQRVVIVGACRGWMPEPPIIRLADRQPGLGPLGAIETLLASGLDRAYVVVGCDQPLLTPTLLGVLTTPTDPERPCFLRTEANVPLDPLPGYFPATWLSTVHAALQQGQRSIRALVRRTHATWVTIPPRSQRDLASVNTPDQVAALNP